MDARGFGPPRVPAAPSWRVVGASATGPGHLRAGIHNQDHWDACELPSGPQVIAVADGAGSRSRAKQGAVTAVTAALDAATVAFGPRIPTKPGELDRVRARFVGHCLEGFDRGLDALLAVRHTGPGLPAAGRRDYATTLLAVVAYGPWLAYMSVGDCFLVVIRDDGVPYLLVGETMDREDQGSTVFLTSSEREAHIRSEVLYDPGLAGFALATDGLIEALLTTERTAGDSHGFAASASCAEIFPYAADPMGLTRLLDRHEVAATSPDDKTLILAVRQA